MRETKIIFSQYTYQDLKEIKKKYHLNASIYNFILTILTTVVCCYGMTLPLEKGMNFVEVILMELLLFSCLILTYFTLTKIFANGIMIEKCMKLQKELKKVGLTKNAKNIVDLFKDGRQIEIFFKNGNIKEHKSVFINEDYQDIFNEYGLDFSIFDNKINEFLQKKGVLLDGRCETT